MNMDGTWLNTLHHEKHQLCIAINFHHQQTFQCVLDALNDILGIFSCLWPYFVKLKFQYDHLL